MITRTLPPAAAFVFGSSSVAVREVPPSTTSPSVPSWNRRAVKVLDGEKVTRSTSVVGRRRAARDETRWFFWADDAKAARGLALS
jgi:hypothetical protein